VSLGSATTRLVKVSSIVSLALCVAQARGDDLSTVLRGLDSAKKHVLAGQAKATIRRSPEKPKRTEKIAYPLNTYEWSYKGQHGSISHEYGKSVWNATERRSLDEFGGKSIAMVSSRPTAVEEDPVHWGYTTRSGEFICDLIRKESPTVARLESGKFKLKWVRDSQPTPRITEITIDPRRGYMIERSEIRQAKNYRSRARPLCSVTLIQ
jgi:hypothetical protein